MSSCHKQTKPLRVARYLRVSKHDQDPALQENETTDLIERRGWQLVGSYTDHGVSGSREKRPELDRMLVDARKKRFDAIVVYRADRLFRSLKHMVVTLDELSALGIEFVSASEVFDTTTPQGKLLLHLVAAFAEFERGVLIERTKAGVEAARKKGKRLGRPPAQVNVATARGMLAGGISLRRAAKQLGIGVATLSRALALAA